MWSLWKDVQLGCQVPGDGHKGLGSRPDCSRHPAAAHVQRGGGGGEPGKAERAVPHCSCQCLVFKDAPNGMEAILAAGMKAVMVLEEHLSQDLTRKATAMLKSLENFEPQLFGLPVYI